MSASMFPVGLKIQTWEIIMCAPERNLTWLMASLRHDRMYLYIYTYIWRAWRTGNVLTLTKHIYIANTGIHRYQYSRNHLPRPLHLEQNRSESLRGGSQIICSLLQDADVWNPTLCRAPLGDASMNHERRHRYTHRPYNYFRVYVFRISPILHIRRSIFCGNTNHTSIILFQSSAVFLSALKYIQTLSFRNILFITFYINFLCRHMLPNLSWNDFFGNYCLKS